MILRSVDVKAALRERTSRRRQAGFIINPYAYAGQLGTYDQEVTADAPVHRWRLGETSGTVATDNGSSVSNGTYSGTYTLNQAGFVTGGKSVLFPGTGATQVNCNTATDYTAACSLECFFNATAGSDTNQKYLISKNQYFASGAGDFPIALFWQQSTSKLFFALSKGDDFTADLSLSTTLVAGTSYHAVGVYQANGLCSLYVNGALAASSTIAFTINSGNGRNWRIGAALENAGGVGGSAFAGRIGEVAIYNTALSGTRAAAHYNSRAN